MSWVSRVNFRTCCYQGPLVHHGESHALRTMFLFHILYTDGERRCRWRLSDREVQQIPRGVVLSIVPGHAAFPLDARIAAIREGALNMCSRTHLFMPKANLAARCRGHKLSLLADRASGDRSLVCLFDAASQDQTKPIGLLAINCYSPVDPHRHNLPRSRTHNQQHHGTVVDVFHLEEKLQAQSKQDWSANQRRQPSKLQ